MNLHTPSCKRDLERLEKHNGHQNFNSHTIYAMDAFMVTLSIFKIMQSQKRYRPFGEEVKSIIAITVNQSLVILYGLEMHYYFYTTFKSFNTNPC
jgi:hypothetical protein